jgi:hypothetical protein
MFLAIANPSWRDKIWARALIREIMKMDAPSRHAA